MFFIYWLGWWTVVIITQVVLSAAALAGFGGVVAALWQFRAASQRGARRAWLWLLLVIPGGVLAAGGILAMIAFWPKGGPFDAMT